MVDSRTVFKDDILRGKVAIVTGNKSCSIYDIAYMIYVNHIWSSGPEINKFNLSFFVM